MCYLAPMQRPCAFLLPVVAVLGPLPLAGASAPPPAAPAPPQPGATAPALLDKVEVTAQQQTFYNAIDRKVYLVGKDVVSGTGSASDLLQNVPSVQVDVEGKVSLRGDSGVAILVNGKSSAAIERDPAAALEALPADAIERVEVITNPSAKHRPEGTAGIINLVLKRTRTEGRSGTLRANAGNDGRYNASLSGTEPRGRLTLHGRLAARQDSRPRDSEERRAQPEPEGGWRTVAQRTEEEGRPHSLFADAGLDFKPAPETQAGVMVGFGSREDERRSRQTHVARGADGTATADRERVRRAPEREQEWELELRLTHAFDRDRELEIELESEIETEREDDWFTTHHRTPQRAPDVERTLSTGRQRQIELTIDYTHELAAGAKLEAGYAGEYETSDSDADVSLLDSLAGEWRPDARRSDRFIHDTMVHAAYATYGRPVGKFGYQAGLRFEHAADRTERPDAAVRGRSDYQRLYPSLHLSHDLRDAHRLQLNYSHRVDRPDGRDLNPFVDYEDPSHLRAGNPALRPEHTHSIEAGWEYRAHETTLLASIYHRHRYDGVTDVTRFVDATTLLTTPENVGQSRSSGLELGATGRWRDSVGLDFSANVFRHEFDARNLGFAGRRAATAWEAKLNVHWDVSKRWVVQLNTSYRAPRLTAQGERSASTVTNLGMRHDLKDGKTSLIATVSDLFGSLRDRTTIDTPELRSEVTRRRSSQVIYLGIVRHFGSPRRAPNERLEFDDTL